MIIRTMSIVLTLSGPVVKLSPRQFVNSDNPTSYPVHSHSGEYVADGLTNAIRHQFAMITK